MKQDSLLKSSTLFSVATLISRVLGLARDACIAAYVPKVWQDIFWAGIKIPSTFRQLFAEGALSAAFIPILTRMREREGEERAREVGFAVLWLLLPTVSLVVLLSIYAAPVLVPWVLDFPEGGQVIGVDASGAPVSKVQAGVLATQAMFPFLIFIAMAAWIMGVLNTYRYFFLPALASSLFNICLITGTIIGAHYYSGLTLLYFLSGAVILGGFCQFALQLIPARSIGYFPFRWVSPFHPMVREFLQKLAPSVFGLAIYQLNALITQTYFASKYGEGGISTMNYAHRLIQFPLGVVGVALATASFPRIAQLFEQERLADAAETVQDVLKYLLLLMVPAAVGFWVVGVDIVGVIYDRGEFQQSEWLMPTYGILAVYSIGLFSYAGFSVLARTFQAQHDFRTPVICGGVAVAVNILLCAIFVQRLPVWSLALAAAIASTVNMGLLYLILRRRLRDLHGLSVLGFGLKVLLAALGMGGICAGTGYLLPDPEGHFLLYLFRTALGVSAGVAAYSLFGWILFRQELRQIIRRGRKAG